MEPSVRAVANDPDRQALARLPRVGAASTGLCPEAFAASEGARDYGLFLGADALAGLRLRPMDRLPEDSPWHAHYGSGRFPLPQSALWQIEAIHADPARCTPGPLLALFEAAFDGARGEGAEVLLLAAPPPLVGHAEIFGCRRLGPPVDTGAGLRLPMALVAGDWAHLEAVRSPLLPAARRHAPNFVLPDWFDRHFPEFSRPANTRAQRETEFIASLIARWRGDGAPLLEDLSADQRRKLQAAARTIEAGAGDALLRQGETDRDLFLILDGAIEVSETRRGRRQVLTTLGAGQIFGEGGFLVNTPRSADLTAIAPSRLLAFSPEAFDALAARSPKLALTLLRNLSRALCLRVYAGAAN